MEINILYLVISVVSILILLVVNEIGVKKGYYKKGNESLWFDKVMHFLGGFFVAMFWSGLIHNYLFVILLTLAVGVVWEIGEYVKGMGKHQIEVRDTVEDLIFDTFGAVVWILMMLTIISRGL